MMTNHERGPVGQKEKNILGTLEIFRGKN